MIPLPDPTKAFAEQDKLVLFAQALFGEFRGECSRAKIAGAWVIRNRVEHRYGFGIGYNQVILQHAAFSCFLMDDPNYEKIMYPQRQGALGLAVWNECYQVAQMVHQGLTPDPTDGAVFYFAPPCKAPPRDWGPVSFTVKIGHTSFYRALPDFPQATAA